MQIERIRALIKEGIDIERQTGTLRRAVIDLARLNGRAMSAEDAQQVIEFASEYVEHAPALMMLIEDAAETYGVLPDVQPVLDATEEYFLSTDDIIPDHFGLVGLIDDAYLTHTLMQAISDKHRSQTGKSLLPLEAHDINAFVRRLIGEPFVSILDDHVSETLGGPSVQKNFEQILVAIARMDLAAGPDPIWGDAPTSEIAGARLQATGVFQVATFA